MVESLVLMQLRGHDCCVLSAILLLIRAPSPFPESKEELSNAVGGFALGPGPGRTVMGASM